jgi:hypothetical protein
MTKIQDSGRGSHAVADVRNTGIRAGGDSEPGAFAFYYPNNDVLNGGRPTPAAGLDARTPVLFGSGGAYGTYATKRYAAFERR